MTAACPGVSVLACSRGQSSLYVEVLDGSIDAVVFVDAGDVPVHDLGDGVLMSAIHLLEPRNCDLKQVAIHGGIRRCGRRRDLCVE